MLSELSNTYAPSILLAEHNKLYASLLLHMPNTMHGLGTDTHDTTNTRFIAPTLLHQPQMQCKLHQSHHCNATHMQLGVIAFSTVMLTSSHTCKTCLTNLNHRLLRDANKHKSCHTLNKYNQPAIGFGKPYNCHKHLQYVARSRD